MYRILIADDEGIMLEAFKGVILGEFGEKCIVETAKTGRVVIEKAETFHPDVVFMDIHMPGINGIQAMREIRKFNNSALFYFSTPLILEWKSISPSLFPKGRSFPLWKRQLKKWIRYEIREVIC